MNSEVVEVRLNSLNIRFETLRPVGLVGFLLTLY